MNHLEGRSAVVCGASAGIGRASAVALAELGAHVILWARRRERLDEVAATIEKNGGKATAQTVDLQEIDSLASAAQKAQSHGGAVHILVNNAAGPKGGPLLDASPEEFVQGMERHLLAAHTLVQQFLGGMRDAGYGRIINIVSTSVYEPIPNLGVSNTVRGAIASWSKSLSRELPPGVTINNVLPGFTNTERLDALRVAGAKRLNITEDEMNARWLANVPEGRLAQPEEVAAAVAFLASPQASFIRGVSLPVDGGRLMGI